MVEHWLGNEELKKIAAVSLSNSTVQKRNEYTVLKIKLYKRSGLLHLAYF